MSDAPPEPVTGGLVAPEQGTDRTGPGRHVRVEEKPQRSGAKSFLTELPILVLVALAVAVLIKTFLVQAFYIPSGSMIPTLEINDRVLVNKLAYRFGEPHRGDVVVFDSNGPEVDESVVEGVLRHVAEAIGLRTAATDDFIKRVIAVEGDTVRIARNRVLVNGEPIDEPYLPPGTVMPDEPAVRVGPGELFVMGDNREHSQDSRVFGPIPVEEVVGRAFVRIWPPSRWGGL
ncbi:MAG TPA: signal peptidase I [Acidimicrobiia bacterium]|nr:signal peptidase I [Acidimicrobiia bacterium]